MVKKIIIFGGCHVSGYPIGESLSFVEKLRNHNYNITAHSHVLMRDTDTILREITSGNYSCVIFQLGNYEFPRPIRKKIVEAISTYSAEMSHFASAGNYKFSALKIIVDKIFSFWGAGLAVRLFDIRNLACLLEKMKDNFHGEVIFFSPIPSKDPWVNYSRQKGSLVMKNIATSQGYAFLDIKQEFLKFPLKDFFHDAYHLNTDGHTVLAEMIINHLEGCGYAV